MCLCIVSVWELIGNILACGHMGCCADKSQRAEDRMMFEHQKEVRELRKEIREKDIKLDDLTQDTEVQIQVHTDT